MCNDNYSYLYEHVGILFIFNHSYSCNIFYLYYETYIERSSFAPHRILLTLFFLHTLDYVVGFSVSMIIGQSQDIFHGFELMMKTGTIRTIYTVINKALQVSLFFLLGAQYEKIRQFDKRYLGILFGITTSCYIIMSVLLS